MSIEQNKIEGVICRNPEKHNDHRGWLTEVFRNDELDGFEPAMCYVSLTLPGIIRGPHEHRNQTDYFVFAGPGTFEVHLWDNRPDSPTFGVHQIHAGGDHLPLCVIVPPGVVHGYRITLKKLEEFQDRSRIHRKLSLDAVWDFPPESVDFVYIDANHAFEHVYADMEAWFPKVRKGGILAGHDFLDYEGERGRFGVQSAVEKFARETGLSFSLTEEDFASWYFIL